MIALALYLVSIATLQGAPRHCEEYGKRLDGTRVTVCDGRVVRVRDDRGNSREWEGKAITLRSAGAAPLVLER
jgi:hypothetical protein